MAHPDFREELEQEAYEHICKLWTEQPHRFKLDPVHHMPGLNT